MIAERMGSGDVGHAACHDKIANEALTNVCDPITAMTAICRHFVGRGSVSRSDYSFSIGYDLISQGALCSCMDRKARRRSSCGNHLVVQVRSELQRKVAPSIAIHIVEP